VAFYVDEHNRILPHSAFRGQTPDEMYFDTGAAIPADLTVRAAAARRARAEANRSVSCATCPSVGKGRVTVRALANATARALGNEAERRVAEPRTSNGPIDPRSGSHARPSVL
jgi:hypothetical protein